MNSLTQCENAKEAALSLAGLDRAVKKIVLLELANDIETNIARIIKANEQDLSENKGLSKVLKKRLTCDEKKVQEMATMVRSVAELEDPVGKIIGKTELGKGLVMTKVSVPIGVLCCIFESRPEVVIQISALAIKSGNAVLLKGGSEAKHTNKILSEIVRKSIKDKKGMPIDSVQLLETREQVSSILQMDDFIDLIIPRGSNELVKYIQDNTKIAVMGHADGICHTYIDAKASIPTALKVAYDAKCQYAAVCNAMETLLVHEKIAKKFLPKIAEAYKRGSVEMRGDAETRKILKGIKKATDKDWSTEYNDLIVSIKIVKDLTGAIRHINKYGSGHTDVIVTTDKKAISTFTSYVDSASVMVNASSRFADGFRYGFGAEVGIATGKIHARGPVGIEGLSTYKYIIEGDGHIVDEFETGRKKFTHKKLR